MVVQVSPIQNHTIKSVLEECWDISHQFRDSYPTDQSITELDGIEANLDTVWERCKANDQAARVEAARVGHSTPCSEISYPLISHQPNWERFDEEMDTIDSESKSKHCSFLLIPFFNRSQDRRRYLSVRTIRQ